MAKESEVILSRPHKACIDCPLAFKAIWEAKDKVKGPFPSRKTKLKEIQISCLVYDGVATVGGMRHDVIINTGVAGKLAEGPQISYIGLINGPAPEFCPKVEKGEDI